MRSSRGLAFVLAGLVFFALTSSAQTSCLGQKKPKKPHKQRGCEYFPRCACDSRSANCHWAWNCVKPEDVTTITSGEPDRVRRLQLEDPNLIPSEPTGTAIYHPSAQPKVMVFGDTDHRTYLGCLSCASSAQDSIFNEYGKYGHCDPFSDNLYCRNPFGKFGPSGPFHDKSACAQGALDPPVIVDQNGGYYGRFSVGGPFAHVDAVCSIFGRFSNDVMCRLVRLVCNKDEY